MGWTRARYRWMAHTMIALGSYVYMCNCSIRPYGHRQIDCVRQKLRLAARDDDIPSTYKSERGTYSNNKQPARMHALPMLHVY